MLFLRDLEARITFTHFCTHTYYSTEAKERYYRIKIDVDVNMWKLPMCAAWPLSWICALLSNSVRATVFPTVTGL